MTSQQVRPSSLAQDIRAYGAFIDGRFQDIGEDAIDVYDPATSTLIGRVAEAGAAGVDRSVAAAERAFPHWSRMPMRERAALISELAGRVSAHAEDLALLDSRDTGNPLTAARADVAKGIRGMNEAAGLGSEIKGETYPLPGLHYTQREPWGVVARMVTFNHPTLFTCRSIATALIAGNCVIIKPSELAPLSPMAVAELTSGLLPDGVVSVVPGGPATGSALVRHPRILRLTFTGSTATALRIQAAAAESGRIRTLTFELGGKNPIVVFPDVDRAEAAAAIVRGMNYTRAQGQSCGSTSRLVIHESIAEDVLDQAASLAQRIRIGVPTDPETEMGTMITQAARDRCVGVIERARSSGAVVVTGGRPPASDQFRRGAFLEPTIVSHVTPGSEIANEEIFGPVLAAMTYRTEDEAIGLANEGPYGLTAAVWTQDIDRALRVANAIDAGYVWINDVETRFPGVPFGGWGNSGIGLEHGLEEILSMTRVKAVNVRLR